MVIYPKIGELWYAKNRFYSWSPDKIDNGELSQPGNGFINKAEILLVVSTELNLRPIIKDELWFLFLVNEKLRLVPMQYINRGWLHKIS